MRLIDADKLIADTRLFLNCCGECCKCEHVDNCFANLINKQQTAYSVENVISKIANKMFSAELYGDEWDGQMVNNLLCMGDVYEIIKEEADEGNIV